MSWDNKYYESNRAGKQVGDWTVLQGKMLFWMGWKVVSEIHSEKTLKQRPNKGGRTIQSCVGRICKSERTLTANALSGGTLGLLKKQ